MARKVLTKKTQRNLSSCLTAAYAGRVASTFFVTVFLFPLNEFLRKIGHEPDISSYVHRKNREHEKHGSGADD